MNRRYIAVPTRAGSRRVQVIAEVGGLVVTPSVEEGREGWRVTVRSAGLRLAGVPKNDDDSNSGTLLFPTPAMALEAADAFASVFDYRRDLKHLLRDQDAMEISRRLAVAVQRHIDRWTGAV